MTDQEKYAKELHRQARRRFPRRRIQVLGENDLMEIDLVEMHNHFSPSRNKGYKYVLVAIDLWTRFAYAKPLKSKAGPEVAKAYEDIIVEHGSPFRLVLHDRGREFYNKDFQAVLKRLKTHQYSTHSDMKAATCERLNRTLKQKMWRKLTQLQSNQWINILQDTVDDYNHSKHRTIGMTPAEAKKNPPDLADVHRVSKTSIKPAKFAIGDPVRFSKVKGRFEKGYLANWSEEIFFIHKIKNTVPITYLIRDERDRVIEGSFYTEELQKTRLEGYYLVDKILRKRTRNGVREGYVRWKGLDNSFNSWEPMSRLKDI